MEAYWAMHSLRPLSYEQGLDKIRELQNTQINATYCRSCVPKAAPSNSVLILTLLECLDLSYLNSLNRQLAMTSRAFCKLLLCSKSSISSITVWFVPEKYYGINEYDPVVNPRNQTYSSNRLQGTFFSFFFILNNWSINQVWTVTGIWFHVAETKENLILTIKVIQEKLNSQIIHPPMLSDFSISLSSSLLPLGNNLF